MTDKPNPKYIEIFQATQDKRIDLKAMETFKIELLRRLTKSLDHRWEVIETRYMNATTELHAALKHVPSDEYYSVVISGPVPRVDIDCIFDEEEG